MRGAGLVRNAGHGSSRLSAVEAECRRLGLACRGLQRAGGWQRVRLLLVLVVCVNGGSPAPRHQCLVGAAGLPLSNVVFGGVLLSHNLPVAVPSAL